MGRTTKGWRRLATTWSVGFFSLGALLVLGPEWMFPAPQEAGASALRRWLAFREVSAQPDAVQLAIVDRIQAEFTPRQLLGPEQTSPSWWSRWLMPRIERNIACLQRVWFETRCEQYAEVVAGEQMDFLQTQIDFLLSWTRRISDGEREGEEGSAGDGSHFFDSVAEWTSQASGEKRRLLERGIRDGVLCWLATTELEEFPRATRRQLADRLADQLSHGGQAPGSSASIGLLLSGDQAGRLQRNVWLLVETWVQERAREFARLARHERDAYVDGRIDEVMSWNLSSYLESLSGSHAGSATSSASSNAFSGATSSSSAELPGSTSAGLPEMNQGPTTGESSTRKPNSPSATFPSSETAEKLSGLSMAQVGRLWQQATLWTERAEPELRGEMEQLLRQVQWRLLARTLPRLGHGSRDQARSPSP